MLNVLKAIFWSSWYALGDYARRMMLEVFLRRSGLKNDFRTNIMTYHAIVYIGPQKFFRFFYIPAKRVR